MMTREFPNLLREADLASLLGLSVGVFRRYRAALQAGGMPAPLVSIGPDDRGRPLWSLRAVDRWLDQARADAADALREAAIDQLCHNSTPGPCTPADELAARAARLFEDDTPGAA